MNTHADKTEENKSQSVANGLPKLQSSSGSAFQFADNRPDIIAQRKLQEVADNSIQVKQLKAIQKMTENFSSQAPIQLYPKKNADNDEYLDSDYPQLTLIKLAKYGQYQVKGTDKILFYEDGEGYYTDELLKHKADMSGYAGGQRPGISNLGGKSYDFYEASVTSGYLTIEAALDVLEAFGKLKESNRQIDLAKVENINQEIKQRRPIHPIEVRRGAKGYELIQGRHRIYASWKAGFSMIPYNII
jgi:hypothetical protein